MVFVVDEDAVRLFEFAFAPGGDKLTGVSLKCDHRVLVAVENIDPIVRIDRQIGGVVHHPAFGQCGPRIVLLIAKIAVSNCQHRLSSC